MSRRVTWPQFLSIGVLAASLALIAVVIRSTEDAERWVDPARQALAPYKQQLRAALERGLASGAAAAIDACRLEAPRIAAFHSSETVRVGRTSDRLRNPDNAPRAWQVPILEAWSRTPPDLLEHRVVRIDDDWIGYAEPIRLGPTCVTCHGRHVEQTIAARIRTLYPEDRAVDFEPGELRGLFWVELAVASHDD